MAFALDPRAVTHEDIAAALVHISPSLSELDNHIKVATYLRMLIQILTYAPIDAVDGIAKLLTNTHAEAALVRTARAQKLFAPLAQAVAHAQTMDCKDVVRTAAADVCAAFLRITPPTITTTKDIHALADAMLVIPQFAADALIPALTKAGNHANALERLAGAAAASAAARRLDESSSSSSSVDGDTRARRTAEGLALIGNLADIVRATGDTASPQTNAALMHALADAAGAVRGGKSALVDASLVGWCAARATASGGAVALAAARVVLVVLAAAPSPAARSQMLTQLAFHVDPISGKSLVVQIWTACAGCFASGTWPTRANTVDASTMTAAHTMPTPMETDDEHTSRSKNWQHGAAALLVFCRLYAYRLATCDVEEFFAAGEARSSASGGNGAVIHASRSLLPPSDAAVVVGVCRTSLERLLWTESEKWVLGDNGRVGGGGGGGGVDDDDSDVDDDDVDDEDGDLAWCSDDPFAVASANEASPSSASPHNASVYALYRQLILWLGRVMGMLRRVNDQRAFVDRGDFYAQPHVINLGDSRAALDLAAAAVTGVSPSTSTSSPGTTATALGLREPLAKKVRRLLRRAPFLLPFLDRVRIFRGLVSRDREEARRRGMQMQMDAANRARFQPRALGFDPAMWMEDEEEEERAGPIFQAPSHVHVQRGQLLEDGFRELNKLTSTGWKRQMRIAFKNEHGVAEAGIDGGGLFKDFIGELTKDAFAPGRGLFCETDNHELYPNPKSDVDVGADHLAYFSFLGRVIGKALYEEVLVDLPFASFFLTKILGRRANDLDDLPSLDGAMYKSLKFLQRYSGDARDLSLTFTASRSGAEVEEAPLIPDGENVAVTSENKLRYIHLVAHLRLNVALKNQSAAFLRGMSDVVDPMWLRMFDERELQVLIAGADADGGSVDVSDWRRQTTYGGGYSDGHDVVKLFWRVMDGMSADERKAVLKFATACSRAPVLGFGALEPKFCIHRSMDGGSTGTGEITRLPSASTCMNLLKLPPYRDEGVLRDKLLYAAQSGAGFDLS